MLERPVSTDVANGTGTLAPELDKPSTCLNSRLRVDSWALPVKENHVSPRHKGQCHL